MKRVFDFSASLFGLIGLSPLFCILYFVIKKKMGTPVFFTQTRPGLNGKPFKMIKFRTMLADESLSESKRITKLGQFLRASSLDELPELINVLKGEMSLVGPRPLLMEYLPLYTSEQMKRHDVLPGITGHAQINGRNAISWEEKFQYDLWYVNNQTFLLDLKILFFTFYKVFRRDGINKSQDVTMTKFEGSKKEAA